MGHGRLINDAMWVDVCEVDDHVAEPLQVLIWFGKNHPEALDLDSYLALVARQIQRLPGHVQVAVRRWMSPANI